MSDNKKCDKSLRELYREQEEQLVSLTQEEIEELYVSEGIIYGSSKDRLLGLKEEIRSLKDKLPSAEDRLMAAIFGEKVKTDANVEEIKKQIEKLEKKYDYLVNKEDNFLSKFNMAIAGNVYTGRKFPSQELRNKIVEGTYGIAKYWARVYYYKSDKKIPYEELLQISSLALISAAHYYVPNDSAKFSTYARKCIENKLKTEIYGKKKKVKEVKVINFFENEKDKVEYIKMFMNSIYHFNSYTNFDIREFKSSIRNINNERYLEDKEMFPYVNKGKDAGDKILKRIINFLKSSKMKLFITDEDRELANLVANYYNIPQEKQREFELQYFFDLYLKKINMIQEYVDSFKELMRENDGIMPSDQDILEYLNDKVKLDNKERYRLLQEGFFKKYKNVPKYKKYELYYHKYGDIFGVNFLLSADWDDSRAKEKEKIKEEIRMKYISHLEKIEYFIDTINCSDFDKVVIYINENIPFKVYELEEFKLDENYDESRCKILSPVAAKKFLEDLIDETINRALEEELERRKKIVQSVLVEENNKIREYNTEFVSEERRKYSLKNSYKRYYKEEDIESVKKDIQILFADDEDLISILDYNNSQKKRNVSIELEDEVINNLFLEDYYKALQGLPHLEREVLLRYFDSNGVHSMTAKEIGEELNITPNKVYKLKRQGLDRLSNNIVIQSYCEE